MSYKCRGFWRWRCNFEPRYDEGQPLNFTLEGNNSPEGIARIMNAAKSRTYVCDVCTACGERRERAVTSGNNVTK